MRLYDVKMDWIQCESSQLNMYNIIVTKLGAGALTGFFAIFAHSTRTSVALSRIFVG